MRSNVNYFIIIPIGSCGDRKRKVKEFERGKKKTISRYLKKKKQFNE